MLAPEPPAASLADLTMSRWLSRVAIFLASALASWGAEPPKPVVIGTLDFFGLRHVVQSTIEENLKIKEGDGFDRQRVSAAVAGLEKLPGVQKATFAPITGDGSGQIHLFVGIQETGSRGFILRAAPTGGDRLPEPLAATYRAAMDALGPAIRAGRAGEDDSQGHSLSEDPAMRKAQDAALALVPANLAAIQQVLKSSASKEDRRAAAWLLGYAPDKTVVTADLTDAARDPDSTVRNNATRALGAIAVLAAADPKLGIRIEPDVFIEMLDSVTWTDRNKAAFVLDGMTKSGDPKLLGALHERVLPDLIEMARWKSEGHSMTAALILGRISGRTDEETLQAWDTRKEEIIAAAKAAR